MAEIRLGTIGSGSIVKNILGNVIRTNGISLCAVYSRSEEKGRKLAEEFGCDTVYTDIDSFMHSDRIDTVYVASPNNMHFRYTKMALEAGKNVICEKPFTPTETEAIALKELAEEKGLILVEAVPTTFLPNFRILKENLKKIGPVKLVQANYSQYSSRFDNLLAGDVTNVFNPDFAGGCLMDINYYNVYLTIALFGFPKEYSYYPNLYNVSDKMPVNSGEDKKKGCVIDTSGMMYMAYDGFSVMCSGAKDTWGVNFYQIEGEKGFIYAEEGGNGMKSVRVVTKTSDETFNLQEEDRLFYEVQELTRIISTGSGKDLLKKFEYTVPAVRLVENARKNAGILFKGE